MAGDVQVASLFGRLGLVPDEKQFERGDKLLEGIKKGLALVAGAEAIKFIGEMVNKTVEAAVGAERMGQKLGISSDAVQELGYAADVTGSSTEGMQVSLQHLARGLEELRTKGTGPAQDGLNELGLSFDALRGKTPDQQLAVLADRFAKMPDGAAKTAAAINLFGRSGTELIPLLDRGAAGVAELRAEAEKLGVVIDKDGIEKAKEYEESQKKIEAALRGVRNEAVIALLPAIQRVAEGLLKWISANREVIESTISAAITVVTTAFEVLGDIIEGVVDVVQFLGDHTDVLTAAIAGLSAVALPFIVEFVAGAIAAAAAWIVAAAPIILVGLAVAAVTLGVIELIKHFDKVKEFAKRVGTAIVDAFKRVASAIIDTFKSAFDFIANLPVVKQILEAIAWAKGGPSDDDPKEVAKQLAAGNDAQGFKDQTEDPNSPFYVPEGGARRDSDGAGASNISVGPTTINVNAAPGMNEKDLADHVADTVGDHWDKQMRDAAAGVGAP